MVNKIGILTSGGDAPGMNSAIRAVTRVALSQGIQVVGIYDGYRGLIEGKMKEFTKGDVSDIANRGGTILGSARLPEFKEEEVQLKAVAMLKEKGIDALVVIGGDGSYRGALSLTKHGINCVGLPGTIDNDIPGTDFTIGYDTALNTAVECIDRLRDTSSSHHRCSIVELMGNRCGDLSIFSGLSCGAEVVITKETGYDEEEIFEKLNYLDNIGKNHALVIVSEKITDVNALAKKVSENTGFSGRATILGHIQRGGAPTASDRILAARLGEEAVDLLVDGIGGVCCGIIDNKITYLPIEEALSTRKPQDKALYRLFDRLI